MLQVRDSGSVRIVRCQPTGDKGWEICPKGLLLLRNKGQVGRSFQQLPAAGEKFIVRTVAVWGKRT